MVTDISNEPDDAESLVRFLLYTNEFDVQGLVACTSTWMRSVVHPEDIEDIVRAYGKVVDNLNHHVHPSNQYPSMESLLGLIRTGPKVYGKQALDEELSSGASLLLEQLQASQDPLWVVAWGGINTLAQALHHLQRTKSEPEFKDLRSRLRVYTISDQDDTGLWIRVTYPDIFYICSLHGWNQYQLAAWTGISGDIMGPMDAGGPSKEKITKSWLKDNVQIGPFGSMYPNYKFIMEGDTPTFLYLIQNGLGSRDHPEWGSWGGRYIPVDLSLAAKHYSDAVDCVVGRDGQKHTSNKATIWRWRDAFQNDFAARMQWTLTTEPEKANHAPVVTLRGDATPSSEPHIVAIEAGEELHLDASSTYDPDGDQLTFSWYQYREPSVVPAGLIDPQVMDLAIEVSDDGKSSKIRIPPPEKCAIDFLSGQAKAKGQTFHVILEVTDMGSPPLTSYKRIVINVTNTGLRGGRDKKFDTFTDFLDAET